MSKEITDKVINIQTNEELDWDKVNKLKDNALLKSRPDLFADWDFQKNDKLGLNVYEVSKGSHVKVWWICKDCKHEWCAQIKSRKMGNGCRFCKRKATSKALNISSPEISRLLLDSSVGDIYYKTSTFKTDWKCDCGQIVRDKSIKSVVQFGLKCQVCSDGFSFGEKLIYYFLRENSIEFTWEKTFQWSNSKRYDFYIEHLNSKMIIEVHGIQHYIQSTRKDARTLKEEQDNDRYKEQLAKNNGIEHYIVIDARKSDINYIIKSIYETTLLNILGIDSIEMSSIEECLLTSINESILNEWNNGFSVKEISQELKLHTRKISKVLKNYDSVGKCQYDPYRGGRAYSKSSRKKIYQYTMDGELVKVWEDYIDMENNSEFKVSSVSSYCNGKLPHYKNYLWKMKGNDI